MCVHVEVDVSEDAVPCIEADKDQGGQNSTRILHAGVGGGPPRIPTWTVRRGT